jgi:hypothetical protein
MALCQMLDCAGEDVKAEASRPGVHKHHTCVVMDWLLVSPALCIAVGSALINRVASL